MHDKITVSPSLQFETQITEVINHELGKRVSLIFEGEDIEVFDGHHTMKELYEHRFRLFIALCKIYDNYITPIGCNVRCWKSKLHHDGTSFEGWFLLGMTVTKPQFDVSFPPDKFDISYHIPNKYWEITNVIALERAPKYDGYTSDDVLERLLRL
jgi:hypothetical protein